MDVKDMSRISKKWVERASVAGADYQAGTSSPRRSWAQAAAAAEANYKDGVTRAAAAGRFGKGGGKAGDAKFQRGVTEKGVARYPAGVAAAPADCGVLCLLLPTLHSNRPTATPFDCTRSWSIATRRFVCVSMAAVYSLVAESSASRAVASFCCASPSDS